MKILVLNCGSSSIKYQLLDMDTSKVMAIGVVEKIGLKGSFMKLEKPNGDKVKLEGEIIDHQSGINYILGTLISKKHGSINSLEDIDAVGHRVAHGGESFKGSKFINEEVKAEIKKLIQLAPLHNPANLKGIEYLKITIPIKSCYYLPHWRS